MIGVFRLHIALGALLIVAALGVLSVPALADKWPRVEVLALWEKAGAVVGWMTNDPDPTHFIPDDGYEGAPGGPPAFVFSSTPIGFESLPVAEFAHGLVLHVADAGILKAVARQRNLKWLDLSRSAVRASDLGLLAGLRLKQLKLPAAARSGLGLRHLLAASDPALEYLDLSNGDIGDADLADLRALTHLRSLSLTGTRITDGGLKVVASLAGLSELSLQRTAVTDVGLLELAGLRHLEFLNVKGTRVTEAGLKQLKGASLKTVLKGRIRPSNETIAAWKKAGAEFGWMRDDPSLAFVRGPEGGLNDLPAFQFSGPPIGIEALPTGDSPLGLSLREVDPTILRSVAKLGNIAFLDLSRSSLSAADASLLAGLKLQRLRLPLNARSALALPPYLSASALSAEIDLTGWDISDSDLAILARSRRPTSLNLSRTRISDAGLKLVAEFMDLRQLSLSGTAVTDRGMPELARLQRLESLDLSHTRIGDDGLRSLTRLGELRKLDLRSIAVSDATLRDLARLAKLESLSLDETNVTEAGLKQLEQLKLKELVKQRRRSQELGSAPTECSGEACPSLELIRDSCIMAANTGPTPIEVQTLLKEWWQGKLSTHPRTTLLPPRATVQLGGYCYRSPDEIGLYRARDAPTEARPSPPVAAQPKPTGAEPDRNKPTVAAADDEAWNACVGGRSEAAVAACTKVIGQGDRVPSTRRARAHAERGLARLALTELELLTKRIDKNVFRQKLDQALLDFDEATRLNPDEARAFEGRGRALAQSDRRDRALEEYTRAIRLDPEQWRVHDLRGRLHYAMGNLDLALPDLSKAISLFKSADTLRLRAEIYEKRREFRLALADIDAAIPLVTDATQRGFMWTARSRLLTAAAASHTDSAGAAFENGDLDRAMAEVAEAMALQPSARAHQLRGAIHAKRGEVDPALADASEAVKRDPKLAAAYELRVDLYERRLDFKRSLADIEAAQREGVKLDFDTALDQAEDAIRRDPRDAVAHARRGLAHLKRGDLELALADVTKAIEIDPKLAMAYLVRAEALERKSDFKRAASDYAAALAIVAKDAAVAERVTSRRWELGRKASDLLTEKGDRLAGRGDVSGAVVAYDEAIEWDPRNPQAYFGRGSVHAEQGRLDLALDELSKAKALDRSKWELGFEDRLVARMAEVHERRGDFKEAIKGFGEVSGGSPVRSARGRTAKEAHDRLFQEHYLDRARIAAEASDLAAAIALYSEAIDLVRERKLFETRAPLAHAAYMGRGSLLARKGDLEGALSDISRAVITGKVAPRDPRHFAVALALRCELHERRRALLEALYDCDRALQHAEALSGVEDVRARAERLRAVVPANKYQQFDPRGRLERELDSNAGRLKRMGSPRW